MGNARAVGLAGLLVACQQSVPTEMTEEGSSTTAVVPPDPVPTPEVDPESSSTTSTGASVESSEGTSSSTGAFVPDPPPDGFTVGTDVTSITPASLTPTIYLGSYGLPFTRSAEGVHDEIYVRSLAIGLGDTGIVFAVTDLPGLGNRFTRDVRARVAEATGLQDYRILISATHTHASPDFQGLWGGGPDSYRDVAVDDVVASMISAWDARVPASLEVATTVGPNNNRREWRFTDDELTVVHAVDPDDQALGTLAVFAAHPTVLGAGNREISRDWCGYAVDAMEASTGAPALLINGILGDASPSVPPGEYADDFERAQAYGEVVAQAALEGLALSEPIEPELAVDHRTWSLVGTNALFNLAAQVGLLDYDYEADGGQLSVETVATYVRLGAQLQMVTVPGEPVTRLGLPLKDAMQAPHRAVLGQTHDMLGYFIPGDEWMTGRNDDYEEQISLGPTVGDTTRNVLTALIDLDDF